MFNKKHTGFDRKNDYPLKRFLTEKVKLGPYKGEIMNKEKFDQMLDENYKIHGWDNQGIPKAETLKKLNLHELI